MRSRGMGTSDERMRRQMLMLIVLYDMLYSIAVDVQRFGLLVSC